jgi:hypothetical protein
MKYTSTILRFIRDRSGASDNDDVLTIVPSDDSYRTYHLTYSDRMNKISNKFESVEGEVIDYVDNLFTLLFADDDPYTHVQFDSPSFPSVMIPVRKLDECNVRDSVIDILKSTLRNYPMKHKTTKPLRNAAPLTA